MALVPLAYGAAVGLVGWAGYHLVDDATGAAGVFVAESLSAVAVAGLAALPIALFPVPGMPGAAVFAWDRPVWAACYAAGLFAFFLVLMPTPYAWDEVGWSLRPGCSGTSPTSPRRRSPGGSCVGVGPSRAPRTRPPTWARRLRTWTSVTSGSSRTATSAASTPSPAATTRFAA